jgi:hypothetical protein
MNILFYSSFNKKDIFKTEFSMGSFFICESQLKKKRFREPKPLP